MWVVTFVILAAFTLSAQPTCADSAWVYTSPRSLGLSDNTISALHQDYAGRIWVGTPGEGVAVFDGTGWTVHHPIIDGQKLVSVQSIASASDRGIWVMDRSVLWLYSQETWKRWEGSIEGGIADKRTQSLVGGECLNYLTGGADFTATPEVYEGIPYLGRVVEEMATDPRGHLWLLYNSDIILRFNGESLECWIEGQGLPRQGTSSFSARMLITSQGTVWMAYGEYVSAYENNEWLPRPDAPFTQHWALGSGDVVWSGGPEKIKRYINGQWEQVLGWDEVKEGWTRAIAADSFGGVWVVYGRDKVRIVHWKEGVVSEYPYPEEQELTNASFINLLVDRNNQLWVGATEGLYLLRDETTSVAPKSWGEVKLRRP